MGWPTGQPQIWKEKCKTLFGQLDGETTYFLPGSFVRSSQLEKKIFCPSRVAKLPNQFFFRVALPGQLVNLKKTFAQHRGPSFTPLVYHAQAHVPTNSHHGAECSSRASDLFTMWHRQHWEMAMVHQPTKWGWDLGGQLANPPEKNRRPDLGWPTKKKTTSNIFFRCAAELFSGQLRCAGPYNHLKSSSFVQLRKLDTFSFQDV